MLSFDEEIRPQYPPEYESLKKVSSTRESNASISSTKYAPPIIKDAFRMQEIPNQNEHCCFKYCRKKYKCIIIFMLSAIIISITFMNSLNYIDEDVVKDISKKIYKAFPSFLNINSTEEIIDKDVIIEFLKILKELNVSSLTSTTPSTTTTTLATTTTAQNTSSQF